MNLKRIIEGPVLALLFVVIFVYVISGVQGFLGGLIQGANSSQFLANVSGAYAQPEAIKINAQSAMSLGSDLSGVSKIIFEKASGEKLPIASITKLMTAIVVLDNYNLSDTVAVDSIADSQAPIKHDVMLGNVMTVENFLYIMLVGSSNKSAYALSGLIGEQKFVALMNKKAKGLGMDNTFFADPTGLSSQNISTAGDLTKLAGHILRYYPKIAQMSRVKELYVPGFGNVVNTDELLNEIPNAVLSKTGFTTQANGCLLLVTSNPQNNDYLINIVLGADDRFAEMQKLINCYTASCQ